MTSGNTGDLPIEEPALSTAERFAALGHVGVALLSELDEARLLHIITRAATEIIGAQFAAFALRPLDEEGCPKRPRVFHLAAVAGVTKEQEEKLSQVVKDGRGLLEPIFRYGVPILVSDITAFPEQEPLTYEQLRGEHFPTFSAAYGPYPERIYPASLPDWQPPIRSFLGVPLLNSEHHVLGGLFLGHSEPGRFTAEDEALLIGLSAQAAVALENAHLRKLAKKRVQELQNYAEADARRALLRVILNQLPSGVFLVHGEDARLIVANSTLMNLSGKEWEPGQTLKDFLISADVHLFDQYGKPLTYEELASTRALRQRESIYHQLEVIRQPGGINIPVLVNTVLLDARHLLPKSARKLINVEDFSEPVALVVFQDVSALKEAEQLKDEFIGVAAHELKTPLAVLRGLTQTLLVQTERGHGAPLEDWQAEALQGIDQAATRLTTLTEDLLDVTRLQAGRLELNIEPCNLIALTKRVVNRIRVTTNNHELKIKTVHDYLLVNADIHRTEQVLTNLLSNAIKYSPRGGPINIELRSDSKKQYALVSVRDYGIGIPQDQQVYVFNRFMRADNVRDISGSGLGLYICQALIERQGGHIWFRSRENEGTTFYFTLPLLPE